MNTRFREITPGTTVEMIATTITFHYVPNGLNSPAQLQATWWAQEFLPVGAGYERLGDNGYVMTTVLADRGMDVIDAGIDPVTGSPIILSAYGATQWMKAWFNHQHNLENTPPAIEDPPPEEEPLV